MSKSDPWGKEGLLGPYACSLGRQCDVMKEARPWSLFVPAAAGKKAGTTWSPARVQQRAPSFCCSCWADWRSQCAVAGTRGAHHVQCYRAQLPWFALQLWKTGPVCQAASGLQLSSSTDWDLWSLEMRWDDWIWEEDQIEKQIVCQNDGMSALDIQTSCLMHIWFKLHKICSIYQGKSMTYDSSLPDRMGFSVYIPAQLK